MTAADDRCSSTKVHFLTYGEAQDRLWQICRNPNGPGRQPNRVIDCSECGQYVLTSNTRSKPSHEQRSGQRRHTRKKTKTKNR